MIAQRMESQGNCSNNNIRTEARKEIHDQNPKSNPLPLQGSLYNLTLNEVQTHLRDSGKPLGSMNLDELLKTIWTDEANRTHSMGGFDHEFEASLSLQSSEKLSKDLRKKTVDQVLREIQQKRNVIDRNDNNLWEITLEDFLLNAGVVSKSIPGKKNADSVLGLDNAFEMTQINQWMSMSYQTPPVHTQQHQQEHNVVPVLVPQQPIPEYQITVSSLSDTQTPGRKRVAPDDVAEKSVERRHMRMIKNRESAARSRARKMAYTHELEMKVLHLEEENERLRKQNEMNKALPRIPLAEPKWKLYAEQAQLQCNNSNNLVVCTLYIIAVVV